jgi:hypothetical protein
MHEAFAPDRVNPNREFFKLDPTRVIAILKLLHIEDVTAQVEQVIEAQATSAELIASSDYKKRRPRLKFTDLKIPVSALLSFKSDPSKTAIVASASTVIYEGEEQSLTSATRKALNLPPDYALQPSPHWTYEGQV